MNNFSIKRKNQIHKSNLSLLIITLMLIASTKSDITDNTCTFTTKGRIFSLSFLNMNGHQRYYDKRIDDNTSIMFNFCDPFIPSVCPNTTLSAYSFLIIEKSTQSGKAVQCQRFSSNSKVSYFVPGYEKNGNYQSLIMTMKTEPAIQGQQQKSRQTEFEIICSKDESLQDYSAYKSQSDTIKIKGFSKYGCPIFETQTIWKVLQENSFIFGVAMLVVGFVMLFFGILMTHLMIFLTSYLLSFAVLGGLATAFLTPDSSQLAIYFTLLFILFLSTLIAYGLTRLVHVSIFFIGAFLGFIVAALVNSIFCEIFGVYSIWSLIIFQVLFMIPFGLLTFKYSSEIIILSTSLTGSYMVVRPFSWIFGGYPNEFTIYKMASDGSLQKLPSAFYFYLVAIITLAILGAMYQLIKLKRRESPDEQVEQNFVTENVEEHLDKIKDVVENMIVKYSPQGEDYNRMENTSKRKKSNDQFQLKEEGKWKKENY